jgi:hypothetical protein
VIFNMLTNKGICGREMNGTCYKMTVMLNPVRFGQLAHEPASGTSVSSCLSNGTGASCSKMFNSIHAANSRTTTGHPNFAIRPTISVMSCHQFELSLALIQDSLQISYLLSTSFPPQSPAHVYVPRPFGHGSSFVFCSSMARRMMFDHESRSRSQQEIALLAE